MHSASVEQNRHPLDTYYVTYYARHVPRRATRDAFDSVAYADLLIETVDWSRARERGHDPATRSLRGGGDDVSAEHATEAVFDQAALLYDSGSRSGETIEVLGYSHAARRVLRVLLRPKDQPATGEWWGETAWVAGARFRQMYYDNGGTNE